MSEPSKREVTELLQAWDLGDDQALQSLVPLVYHELHRLAHSYMRRESPLQVLQTTALVHEAFIRVSELNRINWKNRSQFFAISAQIMRRVLVDFARSRKAKKRGGEETHLPLDEHQVGSEALDHDLLALDQALSALAVFAPRRCKVVELRYFGGLTVEETASALGLSPETIMRDWRFARAWLLKYLKGSRSHQA